jgi:hypothetical protein
MSCNNAFTEPHDATMRPTHVLKTLPKRIALTPTLSEA